MSTRWQTKRDTAANWTSNDPVLLAGEIGYETDTAKFKIGDGATQWSSLPYLGSIGGDHAALSNLDYASAGHTGFEPTVTKGDLTAASTKITIGGTGTGAVIGSGASVDVVENQVDHDSLLNFVANEHIDWTQDQGATNIHSGNIPDLSGTYQPLDSGLTDISGLAVTDGNIIVGDGTDWVAESGATARTSLGLGTGNSPTFTGLDLSGITDGYIPYMSASGFANGPVFADGSNVGIGTATPTAKLHVRKAAGGTGIQRVLILDAFSTTDGDGSEIRFSTSTNDGADGLSIQGVRDAAGAYGSLRFWTRGSDGEHERLRIGQAGGLFIYYLKSGATQVAAGAAAGELWKTASHATLPDNIVMIGV